MEGAPQRGVGFAQPLLTQPQPREEGSSVGVNDDASGDLASLGNSYEADAINESPMFEVEEGGSDNLRDDFGDGFNLLTQSNEVFKGAGALEGGDSSDGSSESSSSSDDDDASSSESSTGEVDDGAALQERRARNILRNEAFIKSFQSEMRAMNGGHQEGKNRKQVKQSPEREEVAHREEGDAFDSSLMSKMGSAKRKRRGMLFPTRAAGEYEKTALHPPSLEPLYTMSLVDELKGKYPHRTAQIHTFCSLMVSAVQKSKVAWQMRDNIRSLGQCQYSEASYEGDTKLAAPAPILITGSSGMGKTCIVQDAVEALAKRVNSERDAGTLPSVADAYVDCASIESGSAAAVMDSAYRQLYECYHPSSILGRDDETQVNGNSGKRHASKIGRSHLGGDDFEEDIDVEAEDEDGGEEDLLERQRKKQWSTRDSALKARKKAQSKTGRKSARQTRSTRASRASVATRTPIAQSTSETGSIQTTGKNIQNSGSVALFGRAISALIQANGTKRKSRHGWRCAFLILDNADRILSWKKHGSISPLTQIWTLPSVMGVNLTLIFISQSTVFQYSPIHHPPEKLVYATHPQTIHLDSYSSVDVMKSILHVPHNKQSIIGRSLAKNHRFGCVAACALRSKLNDLVYSSMLNSFVPSVISSTRDITEIMRLARLLFPEYVAPLDTNNGSGDPALHALVWQISQYLQRTEELGEPCHDSDCTFCRFTSSRTTGANIGTDLNGLKQQLSEKLDRYIRDHMRSLSSAVMMPGKVLSKQNIEPYATRLPYTTKFLLLAAFLCQSKRPEQDVNLFTTKNTGKSRRRRSNKAEEGLAYASSTKEVKQRLPSFPLERLLSVFYSIIGQYGQHFMAYTEEGATTAMQLGTNRLFQNVSQLIATGLLKSSGGAKVEERHDFDLMEMTSTKFVCNISREDARAIASTVGFPLDKYCP